MLGSSEVGWDAVKEVTAGTAMYQKKFAGTPLRRVAVTNQFFTKGAKIQAHANDVELVTRGHLEKLLIAYPITNHELDTASLEWDLEAIGVYV